MGEGEKRVGEGGWEKGGRREVEKGEREKRLEKGRKGRKGKKRGKERGKEKGKERKGGKKEKGGRKGVKKREKEKGGRVQTCGRVSERVRVCTGCGAVSHAVSCHVGVACGALCGVASAEGHAALRARRPPVHTPHALPPSVSVSARASFRVNPASGYTFGRSSIRLLPVLATNQWLALHQHNRLTSSPRKRNKSKN